MSCKKDTIQPLAQNEIVAQKMDSNESMWCNHGSPRVHVDEEVECQQKMLLKREKQLLKLPSPRALRSPSEEPPAIPAKQLLSISELDPFFEELDRISSTTSSAEEAPIKDPIQAQASVNVDCTPIDEKCRKGKSSYSLIKWSSLRTSTLPGLPSAAKSQDSFSSSGTDSKKSKSNESKVSQNSSSSSEDPSWKTLAMDRILIKNKLKKVSHKVKKHLSATGGFLAEKLARHSSGRKSQSSSVENESGDGRKDNSPSNQSSLESMPAVERRHHKKIVTNSKTFTELDLNSISKRKFQNQTTEIGGLVLQLPNWVDNLVNCGDKSDNSLEDMISNEKDRISHLRPMEWAAAVDYLKRSVGRDFRRGYLALGEKMQLPNLQAVRCLKFNPFHSFLAIGCEEGTLLLLELDFQKPLLSHGLRSEESLQDLLFHVPMGSSCRIQMNETLVGHSYDIRCISWNGSNGKLLTSDEIGVIVGWAYGEQSCWTEELINDRSTSSIRDITWSPDGKKIAVGYEDYSENGSITGGILVAFSDGTHIFNRKFPESQVQFVAWWDDFTVWAIINFTLYTLDENGELGKTYRSVTINSGQSSEIAAFLLKPRSSWVVSKKSPDFALIYKDSCMSLFNSSEDKGPFRVHTQISATCADWSANGLYIVVGGMTLVPSDQCCCPQINLYNYEGKLLQILKIPEKSITSVSWDHESLQLSVAAERQIYFASLRPMYKVASNKNGVHCYAYTKDCLNQLISFWNETTVFTENIPGKVIDVKCFNQMFSVLCMDGLGVYHVFVFGETGVVLQHLCILTMEPFALTMTKSSVICLSSNAVLNWNNNLNSGNSKKFTGAVKTTRQVHVDDFPGIIAKPGEKTDHLFRPAMDCARCLHALGDRLCIARESGKLQLYALPTLGYLQTFHMDLEGDICQQICFNKDGSQLAILSMNGQLRIYIFPQDTGQYMEVILCDNLISITSMIWAVDVAQHICVLEGNNLHILHDGQIVETLANIPSGCYFTKFEELHITLINMDKVIDNPDHPLASTTIIKLSTPTFSKVREAIENEEELLEDIVRSLHSSYSHSVLRKLVADEALRQGEFQLAESVYHEDKNYAAVQFMHKLGDMESLELQKAQIHCFLEDYDQAQQYFLIAGRKDLAIKMWKELSDWDRVNFLSGYTAEDVTDEALESQYESLVENRDWKSAAEICNKLGNAEGLVECCIMMKDYEKLIYLAEKLPLQDPLLHNIGKILASYGLVDDAVQCYVAYGEPMTAMKMAIDTQHWDLAMKLSHEHRLPLIGPALVKHVRSLISMDRFSPAIQILDRCGKIITAGKLLVWKALCMLQLEGADTMEVKKTLVLAAKMLSKRKRHRTKRERSLSTNTSSSQDFKSESDELDLEFLIPEDNLKVMQGHNEWCWCDPWRGAEAVHFLNLTQRFLYNGMMGRGFKSAMHLRNFEDIIGSEIINTLVALTAINNNYHKVASNALLKLETDDESFASVSFNLFIERSPDDRDVTRVQCHACSKYIPDFYSVCPFCSTQFKMCIFSACKISNEGEMWTCATCSRNVELSKLDRFEFCPLCHNPK